MVGGMEDQKLGMGFFLPLKFQKLTGQDFCTVSVSSHAVGFQIRRLDKEIVQGSRSLHQGRPTKAQPAMEAATANSLAAAFV